MAGSTVYFCWHCDAQVPALYEQTLAETDTDGSLHYFCGIPHWNDYLQLQCL